MDERGHMLNSAVVKIQGYKVEDERIYSSSRLEQSLRSEIDT